MTPEQFAEILNVIASKDTSFMAWVNLTAIFLGPIIAVGMTIWLNNRRDDRQRRFQIFKDLMTTRGLQMSYEHVKALNAIEVEFHNEEKIMQAFREYLKCFEELSTSEYKNRTELERIEFNLKKQNIFARLIHAIAKILKINIEQLDILSGGYAPQGWANDENEQRLLRQTFIKLFNNNNGLPIWVSNLHPPVNDDLNQVEKTDQERMKTTK
jgi:hypothetical protein